MPTNPTTHPSPVAVVGAGITGLTAAWELHRAGIPVVVFEAGPRIGGTIGAWREADWLHELGPNSLLEGSREVATFIDEIGLGGRRLYANAAAKKRYIVRGGRLVAMPDSPGAFLSTPLFSWRAKLNLCGEPFRRRGPADDRESVADFVVRRLGQEFLDYAINPFVGGVYAGDPRRLSVRQAFPKLHALEQKHGSLIRGALARRNASGGPKGRIFSFPNGLEELPERLAMLLGNAVRRNTRVRTLRPHEGGWDLEIASPTEVRREAFSAVVCAVPADALATLQFEDLPAAHKLRLLHEVEHPPVASVFTGFVREDVAHPLDGFGVLVPEVEGGRALGMLFSSTLFPGRAPEGHAAITTFVGGARQPELAQLDDDALVRIVRDEQRRLLGLRGAPVLTRVHRWPRAIPQYTLNYQRYRDAIAAVERAAPGLFIGGNARDGISLANCIESGRRLATEIAATYSVPILPPPALVGAV